MLKKLNDVFDKLKEKKPKTIAIACPESDDLISIIVTCLGMNIAKFILVGNENKIKQLLIAAKQETSNFEIINELSDKDAAEKAVQLVVDGKANVVMKGDVHTAVFMKAALNKEKGLNAGKIVSEITIIDKAEGEGLQFITDCAMVISPTLDEKKQILENAVNLCLKLGFDKPKVAILSAVEVINPAMQDTIDAAVLSKMADRGQIKNAIVDGPLALDNILSLKAAKQKNIESPVAGDADIILVPNMIVGNSLRKSLTFYANKLTTTTLVGTKAPIVMTSRSECKEGKLLSIAIAALVS